MFLGIFRLSLNNKIKTAEHHVYSSYSAAQCPSACCRSQPDETNKTTSPAKSNDVILRSLNWTSPTPCLCLWCQVNLWTPWCSNMVFVMDKLWLVCKSSNSTLVRKRSGRPFLLITPFKVPLLLPTWASTPPTPNRTIQSPERVQSSTRSKVSKKAVYSELVFGV